MVTTNANQEIAVNERQEANASDDGSRSGVNFGKRYKNSSQALLGEYNPKYDTLVSDDIQIASGQVAGLKRAEELYGMDQNQIGTEIKDITARRKSNLDGNDPASTRMREAANAKVRAAKASGASQDQLSQLERQSATDVAQQEYKSQDEALGEYQKLMANILGGTTSLEMGMAGLQKSGQLPFSPAQSGITVICTELHRQGYLSSEILEKDKEYGRLTRLNDVAVYVGYIWLARPIVVLMRKSDMFTSLVSIPALSWAHNMANGKIGIIEKIGKPLCRFVGKILISLYDKELVYA